MSVRRQGCGSSLVEYPAFFQKERQHTCYTSAALFTTWIIIAYPEARVHPHLPLILRTLEQLFKVLYAPRELPHQQCTNGRLPDHPRSSKFARTAASKAKTPSPF